LGWLPPADRKRATVQRPKTVATNLMFGLVDSIFEHSMIKPVCLCRVNRGCDWQASALFGRGRAVSSGRRRSMGKMITAHVFDWWELVQHTRCGADLSISRIYECHLMLSRRSNSPRFAYLPDIMLGCAGARTLFDGLLVKIYHLEVVQRL